MTIWLKKTANIVLLCSFVKVANPNRHLHILNIQILQVFDQPKISVDITNASQFELQIQTLEQLLQPQGETDIEILTLNQLILLFGSKYR